MPAFPLGTTYTKGLLGPTIAPRVTASVKQATAARAAWTDQIANKSYAEIQADPRLMASVREAGRSLFGDNCAVCHGRTPGAAGLPRPHAVVAVGQFARGDRRDHPGRHQLGSQGEPDLADAGVRAGSGAEARRHRERRGLCAQPLRRDSRAPKPAAGNAEAGKAVYTANCAVCHGPDGKGKIDVGAPDLTDSYWTHGGDEASIYSVVWGGLQGQMPSWEGRLSPVDRKILALYLVDLAEAAAMSATLATGDGRPDRAPIVGLLVLAACSCLAGANAHLVYVAVTSQPDCVDHVRAGRRRPADRSARPSRPARPGARS